MDQHVIVAGFARLFQRVAVRRFNIHLDPDVFGVQFHGLGKQGQFRPVCANRKADFQGFAVFIHEAVAVGIFPACFRKQFLGFSHVLSAPIRLHQCIVAVSQARRQNRTAGDKRAFQQRLAVSRAVKAEDQRVPDPFVRQGLSRFHIEQRQDGTDRLRFADTEGVGILKQGKVAGSNIQRRVHLPFLQGHGAGMGVSEDRKLHPFKGNGAVPIMGISFQDRFVLCEGRYCIGTGANRSPLRDIPVFHRSIDDGKPGVAQNAR